MPDFPLLTWSITVTNTQKQSHPSLASRAIGKTNELDVVDAAFIIYYLPFDTRFRICFIIYMVRVEIRPMLIIDCADDDSISRIRWQTVAIAPAFPSKVPPG